MSKCEGHGYETLFQYAGEGHGYKYLFFFQMPQREDSQYSSKIRGRHTQLMHLEMSPREAEFTSKGEEYMESK